MKSVITAGSMPPEVVEEWDPIWAEVVELHWFWTFHRDLWGNPQHKALAEDILLGPFSLIRRAFLIAIVMGIGRLLDKEETHIKSKTHVNLSIKRLVKHVQPHCPDELKRNLTADLDKLDKLYLSTINLWRDKRFGHADKEMMLSQEGNKLPDVDPAVIESVLALLRQILETVHANFNGPARMHFPERRNDADSLMRCIRRGYEADQEGFPP